jgi:hypothetical protein
VSALNLGILFLHNSLLAIANKARDLLLQSDAERPLQTRRKCKVLRLGDITIAENAFAPTVTCPVFVVRDLDQYSIDLIKILLQLFRRNSFLASTLAVKLHGLYPLFVHKMIEMAVLW